MFPIVNHINDLIEKIKDKKEIRVAEHPNGTKTICYMISNENTFSDEWSKECRGITFDANGNVISRTLHKFFNVNERESTQLNNLPWDKVVRVMDKRDGSMITPVIINGEIKCKSKKTFDSDVAIAATQFIKGKTEYEDFIKYCHDKRLTPTFEFTSPKYRIVLNYDDENLTLLHIRDNVTGEYYPIKEYAEKFNIAAVEDIDYKKQFGDIYSLIESVNTSENIEGYVIQFENGDMVKLKTSWYLNLHRTVTFTRERDVVEMILNETIDDYKSYLTDVVASHDKVNKLEQEVVSKLINLEKEVDKIYTENKELSRKDFAIKFNKHELFGLLMKKYSGVEPDYKEYFKKTELSNYSLAQL